MTAFGCLTGKHLARSRFKMSLAHPNDDQPIQPCEIGFDLNGFVYQPEKCRKNCGYYGNPIWHGYCSRCWIQQRQKSQAQPLTDGFRHHTGTLMVKPEQARTEKLWKIPDTSRNITNHHPQTTYRSIATAQCQGSLPLVPWSCLHSLAHGDFSDFLKALQRPDAQHLMRDCTHFIKRLQDSESLSLDGKGEQVQEFYHRIGNLYPDHMTEERDRVLDNIEKLVMTRLYKCVFCLDGSEDEHKDLALQAQIRTLSWVTPKMLQLSLVDVHQESNDVTFAITALVEMDSKRAPQDKLACLSRSSDFLFKAISSSKMEPATADDFLSYLIFTLLKANPPRLISNLQYITRFSNPKRLVTGKDGYCFTNICCAVSFIENINASSLDLTPKEFSQLMQQDCLDLGTCYSDREQGTIQQIQANKKLLSELHSRQDRLMKETESLGKEVRNWPLAIQGEVQEIIRKFPLVVNWTKTSHS